MLKKNVDWRKIIRALDAARLIPVAGNNFNLRYVIVSDPDIINQLAQASHQDFIADANYVVVVVSDEESMEKFHGDRGRRYTAQMAGASIQNFLLALTDEGLASTWIGHFYEDMVKGLLNIPEDHVVEALFPVGIKAKNAPSSDAREYDLENLVFFDVWDNTEMEPRNRISEKHI